MYRPKGLSERRLITILLFQAGLIQSGNTLSSFKTLAAKTTTQMLQLCSHFGTDYEKENIGTRFKLGFECGRIAVGFGCGFQGGITGVPRS